MDNSSQYDDIIAKYLSDNLSEDEKISVLEWMNGNEQNRLLFEELKNTWRLAALKDSLSAIDVSAELKLLDQKIAFNKLETELNPAIGNAEEKSLSNKSKIFKFIIAAAIAASVLLVIALSGGLFNQEDIKNKPVTATNRNEKKTELGSFTRHEANRSGRSRKFLLPDGTAVTLSDKSDISFNEPFTGNRRDITLTGRAFFNVAKDKTKPFTVFSGSLSTTAIGTNFSVTAFASEPFIVVRLYEGKVLVKINYNLKNNIQKDFYLLPNQELVYNNQRATASVRSFKYNPLHANDDNAMAVDTLSVPSNIEGSWFMFNNQLLEHVFDQLEDMYHVEIKYSQKDVQNMYFIARFKRGYSLDSILNQIALLNHLKVTKKKNGYIVTK